MGAYASWTSETLALMRGMHRTMAQGTLPMLKHLLTFGVVVVAVLAAGQIQKRTGI
jgi:hypothetical protein